MQRATFSGQLVVRFVVLVFFFPLSKVKRGNIREDSWRRAQCCQGCSVEQFCANTFYWTYTLWSTINAAAKTKTEWLIGWVSWVFFFFFCNVVGIAQECYSLWDGVYWPFDGWNTSPCSPSGPRWRSLTFMIPSSHSSWRCLCPCAVNQIHWTRPPRGWGICEERSVNRGLCESPQSKKKKKKLMTTTKQTICRSFCWYLQPGENNDHLRAASPRILCQDLTEYRHKMWEHYISGRARIFQLQSGNFCFLI